MADLSKIDLGELQEKLNRLYGPGHTVTMVTHEIGTFSLSGNQMKFSASEQILVLRDGEVVGRITADDC